jgi:hypothetical protein
MTSVVNHKRDLLVKPKLPRFWGGFHVVYLQILSFILHPFRFCMDNRQEKYRTTKERRTGSENSSSSPVLSVFSTEIMQQCSIL